ncbi:MAG: PQQ-dependent sugar dehydrogenase [Alphaproteobacteria bacterium]|nr:PQQ-dependent sugar dehydrogenase [Alphaproteobacteria bacterium]
MAMTAVAPATAQEVITTVESSAGPIAVTEVTGGLVHPWGMDWLPDGRMVVTERPGRVRLVDADGALSAPLAGAPEVFAEGQGGMLDVRVDPAFADNRRLWLAFAEPGAGGASTALGHGRLEDGRIADFTTVFRMEPKHDGQNHFGARIVFAEDGSIFLTLAERYEFDPAQDLADHLGTIVRVMPDGAPHPDNPFLDRAGAQPEIWSYGHRNIQAAAREPATGRLWVAEMGPRGGDELNLVERGANYGWPEVSWGSHYNLLPIPDPPSRPEFTDAVKQWTPVIAPSGMTFYTAGLFEAFRGDLLIGGLQSQGITRLELDGTAVVAEELIVLGDRIREVAEAPDGAIHVLVDRGDGAMWRLAPAE